VLPWDVEANPTIVADEAELSAMAPCCGAVVPTAATTLAAITMAALPLRLALVNVEPFSE
jgi:hypothetical protein